MFSDQISIGIIGGSGMLGGALARALLKQKVIDPQKLWISNRGGELADPDFFADVNFTRSNKTVVDKCDVVILSVTPAQANMLIIDARSRLVLSVMAGITIDQIKSITGSCRVVRAMSSPAAGQCLAYSPWVSSSEIATNDRVLVRGIFEACGQTDEILDEAQIDIFTALTCPVPGFVAYFAECMISYACDQGIALPIADRAIRQLFLGAGLLMSNSPAAPADPVREMIDYAGTTAAGLVEMQSASIELQVANGLNAAVDAARKMRL